eukprot:60406_1
MADIWAAGICLYVFASGSMPFYSESQSELFDLISEAKIPYDAMSYSDTLRDLLHLVLEKDFRKRAGVGDCLRHDFCKRARSERIKMLGICDGDEEKLVVTRDDTKRALSIIGLAKTAQNQASKYA